MKAQPEKRGKSRLQFTVRTLLLLTLVISVPMAWKFKQVRDQKRAVAWIREMGGGVSYGHEINNGNGKNSRAPVWLVDAMGVDVFQDVEEVMLVSANVDDLTPLTTLTSVRWLYLSGTPVSDLSPLSAMADLQWLNIDQTSVSDLSPLAKTTRLERFYCQHTEVADLSPLANNTKMLSMNLTGSKVSDLSPLADMTALETLDLRATAVADLSPLSRMQNLGAMDLFDTPATDLTVLSQTKSLWLEIGGSEVMKLQPMPEMPNVSFRLYKYPDDPLPSALESRGNQVDVSLIYKRHDE